MKAILMSIQSKWLVKILNGWKTVELRKRFPKDFRGWVYLYCTKAKPYLSYNHYEGCFDLDKSYDKKLIHFNQTLINGKVVARVWVDNVKVYNNIDDDSSYGTYGLPQGHCLTDYDIFQYTPNGGRLFAIHFSKLEIFDKPKELGEFWADPIDFQVHTKAEAIAEGYRPIQRAPQSWQYIYIEEDK